MEKKLTFQSPKTIYFGKDTLADIKKEGSILGEKVLLITDQVMQDLGYVESLEKYLNASQVQLVIYDAIDSEPTDQHVYEAVKLFKGEHCDAVVSLGGGSCIDAAKAVSILVTNDLKVEDLLHHKDIIKHPPAPHIAIPTTAGTGSEVTDVIVITHLESMVKMMMKHPFFIPHAAIIDPLLTVSCPPSVVPGTGVDAFCHAIEAFLSRKAHPMTDTYARSAMKLIYKNIQRAYDEPKNIEAKEAMSLASMQAGLAFSNASVCLVHGMSRPLGALFNVPHGISNAMLLNVVLDFTRKHAKERLAEIGDLFMVESNKSEGKKADFVLNEIKKITEHLKIPNLREYGLDQANFSQQLNKMVEDAFKSGSPANHPVVPSKKELKQLYIKSYDYTI